MARDEPLRTIYAELGLRVPPGLRAWERRVDRMCDAYRAYTPDAEILQVRLGARVYLFDVVQERLVCAWGVSTPAPRARDAGRMAGFPDPNAGWGRRRRAGAADRGHFIAHAAGGELDINLFPQARRLNRGWSPRGKVYRQMERWAAEHPGTFVFHQPVYADEGWIPRELVYGVLKEREGWWVERFDNTERERTIASPGPGRGRPKARRGAVAKTT